MAFPEFRLLDTMSGEVKPLQTQEPGHLRFYSCGPTVYNFAHIGNFRTFLTADLIVRTAQAIGWNVSYVSNITDVGHLTEDSFVDGQGEDKMARALASKDGAHFNNVWELAEFYEEAFVEDWKSLNLIEPFVRPRATQHMREQILAANQLVAQSNAYETPTGVYFDVESFADYGKLSGNTQDKLRDAVREVVVDDNKRKQADFALWKKDDQHLMQWFSPYGWGFPGWHLECSVMARAYLGDTIDLHGGGEDLIFPHHECEIAQSESLSGKPFCNHWVHTRFLLVNGEKMSKSLGNYYTVRDLLAKGFAPLAIRYALMGGIFSKQFNFTDQALQDAERIIERYAETYRAAEDAIAGDQEQHPTQAASDDPFPSLQKELDVLYDDCLAAMLNNLNTSVALAKALEGQKLILRHSAKMTPACGAYAKAFLDKINALLGIVNSEYDTVTRGHEAVAAGTFDEGEINRLVEERSRAKREKDFSAADALRSQLEAMGVEIQDTPAGTVWKAKVEI